MWRGNFPTSAFRPSERKLRLNLRLLALALGAFAIGTGSFVVAGLLDTVARDLSVSVGTAGQLIAIYAAVYALGSPILVTLTGRMARKTLLLVSLLVFVLANVAAVVIPDFWPLLVSRVVAACGTAVFTPTKNPPPRRRPRPPASGARRWRSSLEVLPSRSRSASPLGH